MKKPFVNIETFTWENLQADVYLGLHANGIHLYVESVITPSLDAIDERYDLLAASNAPSAIFQLSDVDALRSSTIEAFALSIQSQWERQLREFLKGCARELKRGDAYVSSLATEPWANLVKRFKDLRGLPLQAFDSFPDLDLLQLLGNACRHGDGISARKLYELCPELWPHWPPALPDGWPGPSLVNIPSHPPFSQISLPRTLLIRLAHAVIWFWEDHTYIYTNSIERKHPSVEVALAKMRDARLNRRSNETREPLVS